MHADGCQVFALKYMPLSDASLHEIEMLHFCTCHAPDAITRLHAVYENDVFFPEQPLVPIRYHCLVIEYMESGTLTDYISTQSLFYTEQFVR